MERRHINSLTPLGAAQLLVAAFSVLCTAAWFQVGAFSGQELLRGFTATPDPSVSSFQPLLNDSSGNYSLGFLRVNTTQLALAVVHGPSSEPLWIAQTTSLAPWSASTRIIFNGSLVIFDHHVRAVWSSYSNGDRVLLANTSNLLIQKLDDSRSVLWQSFHFPTDTLVENQNFTSAMSLVSSNGLYQMRLGSDFIGLFAKFNADSESDQIYWKHKAMEARAHIIEGQGPIYALLSSNGFLGMYQNGSAPVDVQAFNSFQQSGSGVRRVRLEPDGNLKGYYWTGSSWTLDYRAILNPCDLPSNCGSYGLCEPGRGCSCIDNRTEYNSGGCFPTENNSGEFCGADDDKYRVLRRKGVELPYKELMGYERMASMEACESLCATNCTCWGVVYGNASGFCYKLDYPIQTLVGVGDESKMGYFKVREGGGKHKVDSGFRAGLGLLCGAVLVFIGFMGFGLYRLWRRRKGVSGYVEDDGGLGVGPYKGLASASFRSIELSER